ncbi:phosphatidylserine decarboxylase [Flagellimonas allohymeniacidonis]|uniref:Phosphatidylserine decarboxylase n=1 Tax=Flagellimonas allohymeniacidonis TaxID=2517819 RepID=A0A4V2HSR9_9FLAO|nr:phosphatidylserine decarboxylase [Allomuricauda hymeniacidonis]TAI48810.1 phosphatidylserine decarboxylase [Allomuricauda hymeniacidonis]
MQRKIFTLGMTLLLFINVAHSQNDCPPVKKLKEIYASDAAFRNVVKEMFANLQDMPDGTANPWKNKGIDDLYAFLNEWFYFLPNTKNGLDKIIEFSMLYYHNPHGMKFILNEPGYSWSLDFIEERGKYMDSPESAKIITTWLEDKSIDHDDFTVPLEGFKSFNHFFTRDLKPGARKVDAIADNSALVSPADGVINMINNDLKLETQIPTKGRMTLNLNALLEDSKYAEKFVGGTALAVFLKPDNYHHYHSPISGTVVEAREDVGKLLFGMPDIPDIINNGNVAYNKDYSVFENFRHGYLVIKTEQYGYIGMIPIGLQTIGSVVFEEHLKYVDDTKPLKIYKGDKVGYFAYGGSTVLLIFQKGAFSSLNVKQGQQIGKLTPMK